MKRLTVAIVLVGVVAAALAPSGAAAASRVKRCSTPSGYMSGPFFVDTVRVRAAKCANGRKLIARWGRTSDCIKPRGGPSDRTCRVGRYRCRNRRVGGAESEVSRTTCKRRHTRRAVSFNFGT